MPRSSAFRKANKAITKTREFFSYESPYLTSPVPASETCQGACCADVPTVPVGPPRAVASSPTSARATASSATIPAKSGVRRAPDQDKSGLDELESGESESSDDGDDDNDIPDKRGGDLCSCKTCLAARYAHVLQNRNPKRVAAVAAAKKVRGGRLGSSTKIPAWVAEMIRNAQLQGKGSGKHRIAGSLEKLQDQLLADRDLGDVVCWAAEKIIMLAVPLGDRALRQLIETLLESAEAGSKDRLEKNDVKEVKAELEETLRDPATIESTVPSVEKSPPQLNETPIANAEANMTEKWKVQTMKSLRHRSQAFASQCPPSEADNGKQEKSLNTITRAPITDEEYEEVSARSFYFSGILPHFSKNDVVQLLHKYGEIEKCKLKLQSCNQKTCWLGFFTMVSSESADRARRDLHGRIMDGHALTVERPPDAGMMREVRAQLKNRTAAKPTPEPKELEGAKTEHCITLADKQYVAKRIRELGRGRIGEVLEIIERESIAVGRISKNRMSVDIDYLSNRVLLRLLDFFENDVSCASDDSQSRSARPKSRALKKLKGVLAEHVLEVENNKSSQTGDIPAVEEELVRKRKHKRAVTKWDLLRGLKSAAEAHLKIAIALADEQFERFTDPSVMNAPNLPTGAYNILRNDLLAENIGRLLVWLRDGNGEGDLNQSENVRVAVRDPVARRWKILRRDFPDVPNMISKINPIRDDIRAWIATGRHLAPECLYIDAADEKSRAAIAKTLGDKDVHGLEDLAAFTRRLAGVDKDAGFRLEKPGPPEVDLREAQWSEFLDLGTKTIERYPGLRRLIGLETRLPYHPNHEERHFEDEQCRKRPKGFFSTPTL